MKCVGIEKHLFPFSRSPSRPPDEADASEGAGEDEVAPSTTLQSGTKTVDQQATAEGNGVCDGSGVLCEAPNNFPASDICDASDTDGNTVSTSASVLDNIDMVANKPVSVTGERISRHKLKPARFRDPNFCYDL